MITAQWLAMDLAMFAQNNFGAYWKRPIIVDMGGEMGNGFGCAWGGEWLRVTLPQHTAEMNIDQARRVSRRVFCDLLGFD